MSVIMLQAQRRRASNMISRAFARPCVSCKQSYKYITPRTTADYYATHVKKKAIQSREARITNRCRHVPHRVGRSVSLDLYASIPSRLLFVSHVSPWWWFRASGPLNLPARIQLRAAPNHSRRRAPIDPTDLGVLPVRPPVEARPQLVCQHASRSDVRVLCVSSCVRREGS